MLSKELQVEFIILNVTNCQTDLEQPTLYLSRRVRAAEMAEWKQLGLSKMNSALAFIYIDLQEDVKVEHQTAFSIFMNVKKIARTASR